ncbi:MAG: ATP-dependent Clp protease proteolytic subunit [Lentisphaerae bacterium]|nr:MAG: ATP-dependent Clp protease proteolytic subunit [Lentisphaerota bacterium]
MAEQRQHHSSAKNTVSPVHNSYIIPTVIEQGAHGETRYDLFSRLLIDRIIILGSIVDDDVATVVVGQLLYLQSVDPKKDIQLYINCQGGAVTAGLAIYDTMQMVSCDIQTVTIGQAVSMGALLAAAGTKGKRLALPHARLMIHQPAGGTEGTALDIGVRAREIMRNRAVLNEILAAHTGQDIKQIEKDTARDFYMSAQEAVEYGLVDKVLMPQKG